MAALACGGCAPIPGKDPSGSASESAPAVVGQVLAPSNWRVEATMDDVAVAATVSLIDTASNTTVATTVTDGLGRFDLSFRSFIPSAGSVYILEAVKGLRNNRASQSAARVRTLIQWNGYWASLTGPAIVISSGTTALALVSNLQGIDGASLLSHLERGADNSERFTPVAAVSEGTYSRVRTLVQIALAGDRDPVAAVSYSAGIYALNASGGGMGGVGVFSLNPQVGAAGGILTITGINFLTPPASNTVLVNDETATLLAGSTVQLQVELPLTARSGVLTVFNELGLATLSILVVPPVGGELAPGLPAIPDFDGELIVMEPPGSNRVGEENA